MTAKSTKRDVVAPSPLEGEGWGKGRASAPLGVHESPVTLYHAKHQRHSRAAGNPAPLVTLPEVAVLNPRGFDERPNDGDLVSFIPMKAVEEESGRLSAVTTKSWGEVKKGYTPFQDGDVIFAKITPCMENGKFALATGLHGSRAAGSTEFHVFRPKPELDSKYLLHFLFTPELRSRARMNMKGAAGQLRVPTQFFKDVQIPLPPLNEQRRIVVELETQLTRLDASVTALKRVQANLNRYRASVLKAACEGRLVPVEAELARLESRTFESGAQLVARIRIMRGETPRKNVKDALGPDISGRLEVPEGWAIASVDQVCRHITSGSRDWSQFYGKGIGTFILAQNVRPMKLDLSERQAVDAPAGDAETERTRVQFGDLLVTIVGAKTGDICRVPVELSEHYVCQSVALLRPVMQSVSKFVELFLASEKNGQTIWKRYTYGQGRPHLSFDQLKMTPIPLPPLAEQHRIVAEVERRLSVIEELEATVTANLKRAERLRHAVLSRAFTEPAAQVEAAIAQTPLTIEAAVRPKPNQHFARALLSGEIVYQLHAEPTFGRVKHQKIYFLCEHIAQLGEIGGQYQRMPQGPFDDKLIFANEAELKRQDWYATIPREGYGHAYSALANAGGHVEQLKKYWPDQLATIRKIIELMRAWDTERCEIFSTTYAAWNDLLLWNKEPSADAIIHEILNRWHENKRNISAARWRQEIHWMRHEGYEPVGFGQPTALPEQALFDMPGK